MSGWRETGAMRAIARIARHGALPAAALAIAWIVGLAIHTYAARHDETLRLQDLAGSREAIQGVSIGGVVKDGYHRTTFRVQEGHVSSRTEVLEQPRWTFADGGFGQSGEGKTYTAQREDDGTYKVIVYPTKDGSLVGVGERAYASPSIAYRGQRGPVGQPALANRLEDGIATIGDRVYFTAPVSGKFTGQSGIYELKFYEWWQEQRIDKKEYAPRKLADIDLSANAQGEGGAIEVLGLEAIGGKLALVTAERGALHVRCYDPDTGAELGAIAVPDVRPAAAPDDAAAAGNRAAYEAHPDASRSLLTLAFERAAAGESGRPTTTVLVLDFAGGGIELAQRFDVDMNDGEADTDSAMSAMYYRDGKLYAVKSRREPQNSDTRIAYEWLRPRHLYIYVYDRQSLAYKGELLTDVNDDSIRLVNMPANGSNSVYEQLDYRRFADVSIAWDTDTEGTS
ncbi:hypothetical protein [Cohnella sp. 56]|uniref:hypothetical protein n=1 Tax=Cohnella sp. 56 TaxID=3113722 RepID=UPI0030E9740E